MKDNRPVYLNLMQIKLPITAISSILHRVTGVLLFFFFPLIIWSLMTCLESPKGYHMIVHTMGLWWGKLILFLLLSSLFYHVAAGIRHLLMDMGIGESAKAGTLGARLVLIVSALFVLMTGVCLW